MYKSQLQEYAQKAAIPPPVYEFVKEGASHEPRFKAIVILNNVTYESPPGFPNLKSAEHAAAKAALDGLLQSTGGTGVTPSPVHESGLCKNLLQEYAQKNSLPLPVYQSQRSGEDHAPTFTSSVEIAGVKYSGGSAKNKKEAEIKAARTALLAIQTAQSSVAAPAPITPNPPRSGLATFISSHLTNMPGKKRGRGAHSAVEGPSAGRLKTEHIQQQASLEVTEPAIPGRTKAQPIVQQASLEVTEPPNVGPLKMQPVVQQTSQTVVQQASRPGVQQVSQLGIRLVSQSVVQASHPVVQQACEFVVQAPQPEISVDSTVTKPAVEPSTNLVTQIQMEVQSAEVQLSPINPSAATLNLQISAPDFSSVHT